MFINFRPVKPSAHFALTVIIRTPAECNPPGARECNTQLHSAYTRVYGSQYVQNMTKLRLKHRPYKCISCLHGLLSLFYNIYFFFRKKKRIEDYPVAT
jgi:hypothetical protein